MSIEFTLPNIGEGVDTADVAEILVSEGDTLEADQVICELETDKAVVELPCPHAGVVEKLHIAEGDTIHVGQPVLTISSNGAAPAKSPAEKAQPAQAEVRETATATAESQQPARDKQETPPTQEPPPAAGETSAGATERFEFELPNIGEGVETADVAEIRVSVGDAVTANQTVMDLETEKAVFELPCPVTGTVTTLHIANGQSLKVGDKLLTLEVPSLRAPPANQPRRKQTRVLPRGSRAPRNRRKSARRGSSSPSSHPGA